MPTSTEKNRNYLHFFGNFFVRFFKKGTQTITTNGNDFLRNTGLDCDHDSKNPTRTIGEKSILISRTTKIS